MVLGQVTLGALGIGCIIGAGIFVRTRLAANRFAGPGLVLSFVVAGIGCALRRAVLRCRAGTAAPSCLRRSGC